MRSRTRGTPAAHFAVRGALAQVVGADDLRSIPSHARLDGSRIRRRGPAEMPGAVCPRRKASSDVTFGTCGPAGRGAPSCSRWPESARRLPARFKRKRERRDARRLSARPSATRHPASHLWWLAHTLEGRTCSDPSAAIVVASRAESPRIAAPYPNVPARAHLRQTKAAVAWHGPCIQLRFDHRAMGT